MESNFFDLIHLDPPFNSDANYGVALKDIWSPDDVEPAWWSSIKEKDRDLYAYLDAVRGIRSNSMMSHCINKAIRLLEMRRILKPDGSIVFHCDSNASHYIKILMDAVFKQGMYKNHIDNLQLLCQPCNSFKGAKRYEQAMAEYKAKDPEWGRRKEAAMKAIQEALKG